MAEVAFEFYGQIILGTRERRCASCGGTGTYVLDTRRRCIHCSGRGLRKRYSRDWLQLTGYSIAIWQERTDG